MARRAILFVAAAVVGAAATDAPSIDASGHAAASTSKENAVDGRVDTKFTVQRGLYDGRPAAELVRFRTGES